METKELEKVKITPSQIPGNPQSQRNTQIIRPQFRPESVMEDQKRAIMHTRMQECGVPARYKNMRLNDVILRNAETKEAARTIRGFIDSIDRQMELGSNGYLCGSCGTGKTLLACLLVMYTIHRGYSAMYVTAFKMIQRIRKGYGQGESVDRYIREFVSKDLLVIDEIGVQHGSDDERVLLYQVVDDRYLDSKSTVIISNSKDPVEDGYLDLRVLDRIKEGQFSFSHEFNGESFRK